MVGAFNRKKEQEAEEKITLAWLNARWTIQWLGKKNQHPPTLEKLLNKEPKQMDPQDMLAEVKRLNAMFGGKIVYKTPKERSET